MGKRQDGFQDRGFDDHLLAMQGLGGLNDLGGGNIHWSSMALEVSASLLPPSFQRPNGHQCRVFLSKEEEIDKDRETEKYDVVMLDEDECTPSRGKAA